MIWILYIIIVLAAFFFMEFMAWFTHKYVMHGFLWVLHKDHHIPHDKPMEKNDWFAVMFAIPSIILLYLGSMAGFDYRFYIGLGILLYGLAYFLFHDAYVHKRVKVFGDFSNRYLRATHKAHLDHHKPHSKSNFGFLIAPMHYYKEELSKKDQ
ncbi:MAG: sterol desaturase family protein [Bacteroidales bacterium]|nr:sterol desaturase family protein [Bacteroidales bacterium]